MDSVIESTSFMCIDKWCLNRRLNPKSMHDNILEIFLKWNKWKFRLKVRLGCDPSDEQLASSMRMSRAELHLKMIECSLAREKLAMSNVRLVMSIAQKYDNLGAEMADLVQVIPISTGPISYPSFELAFHSKVSLSYYAILKLLDDCTCVHLMCNFSLCSGRPDRITAWDREI